MTLSKPLIGVLLSGGLSYASSLAVYQDKTFYTYVPSDTFIGLTQHINAKCEGNMVNIEAMLTCPSEHRLCKEVENLDALVKRQNVIVANGQLLDKFVSLPQPQSINALEWIDAAKLLAQEKATLLSKQETITQERKVLEVRLKKQAPKKQALQTSDVCKGDLELTIPYGYVSFSTSYEANLDDKEISVTQKLSIINRSGIDIEADTAMFYYRGANPYVRPIHFSPWVVSKYVPSVKKMYKSKARAKSMPMMEASMVADNAMGGDIMPAPVVSYEDAREYKVTHLKLPSTGVALDVDVLQWKAALSCELRAYPYMQTKAFKMCSFSPKYQIDANSWKVKSGNEVINEHARGEYRDGKYSLYTKIDDDIKMVRKPIVKKERETGIFGGTVRKKDGFSLRVTNKSNKVKTLTLIERIPISTTTEIKSKLLSVKSKKKVDYKMLKNGEIEMHITLVENETMKIDVLFELSYDKDVKVKY